MKLAYYPGCSLEGSAVEYGLSTERSAHLLGIELVELDDWNCCGATSAHNTNKMLSLALPARNLAMAEKAGLDLVAPCAACYNRFRSTRHEVSHDPAMRGKIEQILDMPYEAKGEVLSILELLANKVGLEEIKQKVKNPLTGMKAACYYGCLLVRPVSHTGFDDPENPMSMDHIVEALGAQALNWAFKTECCGAALATSRPDIGNRMIHEVIKNAKEAGAECIVTACPLCMMNLDMRQAGMEKALGVKYGLPVYYVTELAAIALGDTPAEVGVPRHFVEAEKYLAVVAERAKEAALTPPPQPKKARTASAAADGEAKEAPSAQDTEKKVNAFIKAFGKAPDKMAARVLKDPERASILAQLVVGDEKKIAKLAEAMVADMEKAAKVGDAYVTAELRKRAKESTS